MADPQAAEWKFEFGLCATKSDQNVSRAKCDELLRMITQWAEENDYGIGGGYRAFTEEEQHSFPV
jgi:hypothetical protein